MTPLNHYSTNVCVNTSHSGCSWIFLLKTLIFWWFLRKNPVFNIWCKSFELSFLYAYVYKYFNIYKYKILIIKALPNYCLYTRDYFLKKIISTLGTNVWSLCDYWNLLNLLAILHCLRYFCLFNIIKRKVSFGFLYCYFWYHSWHNLQSQWRSF